MLLSVTDHRFDAARSSCRCDSIGHGVSTSLHLLCQIVAGNDESVDFIFFDPCNFLDIAKLNRAARGANPPSPGYTGAG